MNKIFEIKFGSHLFGTATPTSDLDIKGIYLPTAREIVLGNYKSTIQQSRSKADKERNTKDDVDREYFTLDRYLELLCEGQTVAMDMFFATDEVLMPLSDGDHSSEIFRIVRENKDKLITKNVMPMIGYSRTQAAKYGVKGSRMDALKRTLVLLETLPLYDRLASWTDALNALVEECASFVSFEKTPLVSIVNLLAADKKTPAPHLQVCNRKIPLTSSVKVAKDCYQKILDEYGNRAHKAHLDGGRDYKALSHSIRVSEEGIELLKTGHITFPRPNADFLTRVKVGQVPFEQVSETIKHRLTELVEASETSTLREKPDKEWVDQFVCETYTDIVKNS